VKEIFEDQRNEDLFKYLVHPDGPTTMLCTRVVPWLRRLVTGLSSRRPWFDPGSVHVGFLVDKVALRQVFPRVFQFSPVNFIPPVLHYKEKRKKLPSSSQGCTIRLKAAVRP
jgi:hypothetical protein